MNALAPWIAVVAIYVVVLCATTLVAHPLRRQMTVLATDLMDEPGRSDDERRKLQHLIDTCMSSSVGMLLPLAGVLVLVDAIMGIRSSTPKSIRNLAQDPRYGKVVALYMASVTSANPIATLLTIPPLAATMVVWAVRGETDVVEMAEEPIMRASAKVSRAAAAC